MQVWRRVRGLLGSAATWGTVGALIGAALYVARFRPWPLSAIHWDRALSLLGAFMGGGALWGSVCGLAFGAIPFFSMLAGMSAVAGAACARTIFALARRAPEPRNGAPVLAASSPASLSAVPSATPERVQVR